MSKTIKLDDEVYADLEHFRDKRETFSAAVQRLLVIPPAIRTLSHLLAGARDYQEVKIGGPEGAAPPQ